MRRSTDEAGCPDWFAPPVVVTVRNFAGRCTRGCVDVSFGVVICAFSEDRWSELAQAVRSVQFQSHPPRDVVVVIDHNERLLARARAELAPVRAIPSEGRPGLSGARNTGLRAVHGEILAFLDDDARAAPEWLEQLGCAFAEENVLGAGGWIEPSWEGAEPRWLAPELYWIVGCSYRGLPPPGAELRNPIGANMAFRHAVLAELGGFHEGVGRIGENPLGDEETELGIEAHARWPQGRIVHAPTARVAHAVPHARTSWGYLISRCWAEGRSKAQLTGNVGSSAALASERRYATRTLPAGFARGLVAGVRGDPWGFARAAGIACALTITALGYAWGRLGD